jgi:hypothetical protein
VIPVADAIMRSILGRQHLYGRLHRQFPNRVVNR